jgi:hypothetical protein
VLSLDGGFRERKNRLGEVCWQDYTFAAVLVPWQITFARLGLPGVVRCKAGPVAQDWPEIPVPGMA